MPSKLCPKCKFPNSVRARKCLGDECDHWFSAHFTSTHTSSKKGTSKKTATKKKSTKSPARKRVAKKKSEVFEQVTWLTESSGRENGGLLYQEVKFKGEEVKLGDYVLLRNPDCDGDPFVARVLKLIEYPDEGPQMKVMWLYRAGDTRMPPKQLEMHGPYELFMSTATDETAVCSIESKCSVTTKKAFDIARAANNNNNTTNTTTTIDDDDTDTKFFCQSLYEPIGGTFKQLTPSLMASIFKERDANNDDDDDTNNTNNTNDGDDDDDILSDDSDFDAQIESMREQSTQQPKRKRKRIAPATTRTSKTRTATTKTKTKTPARARAKTVRVKPALTFNIPELKKMERSDGDPNKDPYDLMRERLHVSAVPDTLPCREVEYYTIFEFIRDQLCSGLGGCMFVSGVPGTGKTATIRSVARALKAELASGNIVPFDFVEINGMALSTPNQAYTELLLAVKGATESQKIPPSQALELLRKRFTTPSPRRQCTVVLIDELDQLWTRKQEVLYNLFDWPNHKHSRLVVVAVANTMDLPERVLVHRVSSRIGLRRLTFPSYTREQLGTIARTRLNDATEFSSDAIELCARKVAAVSGDARRALDICRRAVELAQSRNSVVEIDDIRSALGEMNSSPMIVAMQRCTVHEKIFLVSVISQFRKTGVEETFFAEVLDTHIAFCRARGVEPPSASTVSSVCSRLGSCRLLLVEAGEADVFQKIRLNCNQDDVTFALQDDPAVKVMKSLPKW